MTATSQPGQRGGKELRMKELNLIVRSEKLEDIKKILIDEFN